MFKSCVTVISVKFEGAGAHGEAAILRLACGGRPLFIGFRACLARKDSFSRMRRAPGLRVATGACA